MRTPRYDVVVVTKGWLMSVLLCGFLYKDKKLNRGVLSVAFVADGSFVGFIHSVFLPLGCSFCPTGRKLACVPTLYTRNIVGALRY